MSLDLSWAEDHEPLEPLEEPDLEQCQADKPGNGPFTMGGEIGDPKNGYRTRCKAGPTVIATEKRPGEDGRRGSMSLCDDCLKALRKELGDDHVTLEPICKSTS